MNQYNSGMRKASILAKRIRAFKGNRFLNELQGLYLDDKAFIPGIRSWIQLHGFRMVDVQTSHEALRKASLQGIRSSFRTGASSLFLLDTNKDGMLSVYYGNMNAESILKSTLPDCYITDGACWKPDGFRFSGIVLGTLASENMADAFTTAGVKSAYIACVITPVADAVTQGIMDEDRRLSEELGPYKSIQRVYGNASRRTVEFPVQEVGDAIAILKDEYEFLQNRISEGLVCAAIRFGANSRNDFLSLANLIQSSMTSRNENTCFEPVRCFELNGVFSDWRDCVSIPHIDVGSYDSIQRSAYAVSFQGAADVASFCTAPVHSYSGYFVDCGQPGADAHELFPAIRSIEQPGISVGKSYNSSGKAVLPLNGLLCHTAVFGAPNTGKTNIVMKVLNDAWVNHGIPFVVLEAAKKEYNTMLSAIPELKIYTPGADGMTMQMNPLQPEEGVLIENHVAAVARAISVATGAEHPIPEAFNGLLKYTYKRFGWEFGTMAYVDNRKTFPTFADVLADVDHYVAESAQYGPEVRQNLTAALKIRCEAYSIGALGRIFSSASGLTAKDFLDVPTVVELADFSEENTAFLMNIVLANTAVKLCLSMGSEDDRKSIGDSMGLSDIQRNELNMFKIGECILSVRGHRGLFHVAADKFIHGEPFSAACMVCACRFRCRKAAVQKLIADLSPELVRYHLVKITVNPYNVSLLSDNIDHMLEDMHVAAAAPTRLCLLGKLLRQANIPMQKSRVIVNAYNNHLKEG